MNYDWVSETILKGDHRQSVTAIVARGKDDTIDALRATKWALLPCNHHAYFAYELHGEARCQMCDVDTRGIAAYAENRALQKALKAIANHGTGLARVVAQLALKEVDRA